MAKLNTTIVGIHAINAILQHHPHLIQQLFVVANPSKRLDQLIKGAKKHGISAQIVKRDKLDQLAPGQTHQGIVAFCTQLPTYQEADLPTLIEHAEQPLLLVLDGVSDPHNLGACLRSANAAGVHAVIAPKDKAVGLTPTARKVASGAAETTPFIPVTNLARTLRQIKKQNVWVFGAASEAKTNIYQHDLNTPLALVLGAEGQGLRRLTRDCCDELISLPMHGTINSLNVSVATGICLYETLRQRLDKSR